MVAIELSPVWFRPVNWLWLISIPVVFIGCVFWFGRRHIAIRRRDCCGKGCGCIFPAKPKQ
jgi:hypothetical protein